MTSWVFDARTFTLRDGRNVLIREALPGDGQALLDYVLTVAGETDNLSFAPDEFERSTEQQSNLLRTYNATVGNLYLLAVLQREIVGALSFSSGKRPRMRHQGSLGITVRKVYWGQGIGSSLLDSLIEWARNTDVIKKIDLRALTGNERAIGLYRSRGLRSRAACVK